MLAKEVEKNFANFESAAQEIVKLQNYRIFGRRWILLFHMISDFPKQNLSIYLSTL